MKPINKDEAICPLNTENFEYSVPAGCSESDYNIVKEAGDFSLFFGTSPNNNPRIEVLAADKPQEIKIK